MIIQLLQKPNRVMEIKEKFRAKRIELRDELDQIR